MRTAAVNGLGQGQTVYHLITISCYLLSLYTEHCTLCSVHPWVSTCMGPICPLPQFMHTLRSAGRCTPRTILVFCPKLRRLPVLALFSTKASSSSIGRAKRRFPRISSLSGGLGESRRQRAIPSFPACSRQNDMVSQLTFDLARIAVY